MEKGQAILVADLKELLLDAEAGQFGDFTNDKYPAPKLELMAQLQTLRDNVMQGKYDDSTLVE